MVRERGVTAVQSARDLDLYVNVLRKWVVDLAADPGSAFPGHGQLSAALSQVISVGRWLQLNETPGYGICYN